MSLSMADFVSIKGTVVRGHRVASGQASNSPYPKGSIEMQQPHFLALGIDLSPFYPGTLNVSIAPYFFDLVPRQTLHQVKWSNEHEAESFSFVPISLTWEPLAEPLPTTDSLTKQPLTAQLSTAQQTYEGLIYYPRPETKIDHFQDPSVVELLMPLIMGITYGSQVTLTALANELIIKS